MKFIFKIMPFLAFSTSIFCQNQAPVIENFSASVNWATNTLTLNYAISDMENDPLDISIAFSNNAGKNFTVPIAQIPTSGDIGYPIAPGTGKTITCDVSFFAPASGQFLVRLLADDRQSVDLQSIVNEIDSLRMRTDLQFVEGVRHRSGNPAHLQAVRDSLKSLFSNQGLFTEEQSFTYTNTTGKNIIGTMSGTVSAEKVVVIDAHYDTVFGAPGADDNGSGTVGVMEIARVLSKYPTKKTVRFIGFDLEEAGLVGSTRYVTAGIPPTESIEGVFNFEMIGYYSEEPNSQTLPTGFNILFPNAYNTVSSNGFKGDFITNVGNVASQSLIDLYSSSAAQYVPELKVVSVAVPGNGQIAPDLRRSDHTPFWEANKKALMLTDGANFRNECYHTPQDTFDNKLNFTFMSRVVKATLAAAAQLAEIQHADAAVASFQNTVSTSNLNPCEWSVFAKPTVRNEIYLNIHKCAYSDANLELFDEKGALLFAKNLSLIYEGEQNIPLGKQLPQGIYLVKLTHQMGARMQKIVLK